MRVRVVAFARVRELVGGEPALLREVAEDATAGTVWDGLVREFPSLAGLERSTRLARNGSFVDRSEHLSEGDELALLPPFGGG
jgi:molybdopterin converting factor small subunit